MDIKQTSYFTVSDQKKQLKFICYTRRKNGMFCICLTDAADVWRTDLNEGTLNQSKQKFVLTSAEDHILNLRLACSSGAVSVLVHDSSAELHVGSVSGDLRFTLTRLEGPKATEELKDMLFSMADRLTHLDSTLPSVSPVKNHQRRPAEFEPRQQQNCASTVAVKRRLPGASLINPGTKRKLQATGVAFDDVDEN